MRTGEKISEATITDENGAQWVLAYYLQVIPTQEGGQVYALRVDKLTTDGALLEREETYAFTDSRKDALNMAKAFAAGTVPPCVLLEMTDEWTSENMPAHTYRRAG